MPKDWNVFASGSSVKRSGPFANNAQLEEKEGYIRKKRNGDRNNSKRPDRRVRKRKSSDRAENTAFEGRVVNFLLRGRYGGFTEAAPLLSASNAAKKWGLIDA
jgi:hypothetical protein